MSKHRENRVNVMMASTIGAGNLMFEGMVRNISRNGFMVADLPMRFNPQGKKVSALISCQQGTFKMDARPAWVKEQGGAQDVGFEILGYGNEWIQLLDILDPLDKDLQHHTDWVDQAVEHPKG